jgi:hypothetical protein
MRDRMRNTALRQKTIRKCIRLEPITRTKKILDTGLGEKSKLHSCSLELEQRSTSFRDALCILNEHSQRFSVKAKASLVEQIRHNMRKRERETEKEREKERE